MEYEQGILVGLYLAVVCISAMHGILLALILGFARQFRSRSNQFLALTFLGLSIILLFDVPYWVETSDTIDQILTFIPLYNRSCISVGLYWFTVLLIYPDRKIAGKDRLTFLPIVLEIVIELMYIPTVFTSSEQGYPELENALILGGQLVGLVSFAILVPKAIRKVNVYQKHLYDNYSTTGGKSLSWLQNFLNVLAAFSIVWLASFVSFLAGNEALGDSLYTSTIVGITLLLFAMGYFITLRSHYFSVVTIEETEVTTEPAVLSSKTDKYYDELMTLMREQKRYCDAQLTLQSLSEGLSISPGYLSKIINEREQKSFYEFINSYRIEEVKRKLINPEFDHYSVMGIAFECGFNSKSTFNTVFKKFTGLTPSVYKRTNTASENK